MRLAYGGATSQGEHVMKRYRFLIRVKTCLALLICLTCQHYVNAQGLEYIKAHYTKYEFRIPMRDGVKLFTALYIPKDITQPYPIMLRRTPYGVGPYGVDNFLDRLGPSEKFAKEGFIFAYQDVRGRWESEGQFVNMQPFIPNKVGKENVDESSDAFDTIDWLVRNIPNNNGKVGIWGVSYPGFYAAMACIDAHPALKAASPQAPIADWFIGDDFHHNGAVFLPATFNFLAGFGREKTEPVTVPETPFEHGTPDGYNFFLNLGSLRNVNERHFKNKIAFWNEAMQHETYDTFWQARNIRPHLRNVRPAVMTVGGWFDAEDLFGTLQVYESIEKMNSGIFNVLVMGPWQHGGWGRTEGDALGNIRFGSKTSVFYQENIEFPFFNFYLKEQGELKLPEAYVFETGRNQWRQYDVWPPKGVRSKAFYLHGNSKLSFDPPVENETGLFDEYISDPAKPVPFIQKINIGMPVEYMVEDQRFASSRTDVLVYQTEVLENDLTVAGPIVPSLFVSTTGTDADWVVKLIDVYPDSYPDNNPNPGQVRMGGYQQLVRGEPMRGKFRHSFEKPEPFEPGNVTKVEFVMPDSYHTFRAGHRVMVHIQSSWFPLVDRNPQKFLNIYQAREEDFQKATQHIYRSKSYPSSVRISVLPSGGALK